MKSVPERKDPTGMTYASLLQKVAEIFSTELSALKRLPYGEMLKFLRKEQPDTQGIYLIWDEKGECDYIGKGEKIAVRLAYHVSPQGDIVWSRLSREGFDWRQGRSQDEECRKAARRVQSEVLSTYAVSILPYNGDAKIPGKLPLGLSELERLAQYLLVPNRGGFPHQDVGWITIKEFKRLYPIPKERSF